LRGGCSIGTCKYCGQSAGLFRKKHYECENKYNLGLQKMVQIVYEAVLGNDINNSIETKLNDIVKSSYIEPYQIKDIIIEGLEKKQLTIFLMMGIM